MSKTGNVCLLDVDDYRLVGPGSGYHRNAAFVVEHKDGTDSLGVDRWKTINSFPVWKGDAFEEHTIEVPGPLLRRLIDLALEAIKARRDEERAACAVLSDVEPL